MSSIIFLRRYVLINVVSLQKVTIYIYIYIPSKTVLLVYLEGSTYEGNCGLGSGNQRRNKDEHAKRHGLWAR